MVSIGSVIGGGFRLFREQPVTLAIWWALQTAYAAAGTLLMLPMQRSALLQSSNTYMTTMLLAVVPFYLLFFIVGLLQSTAAFRAVMRPDERKAGFLRVGIDELRVLGIGALWSIAVLIFYFLMIAFGIVLGRMIYADGYGVQGPGMIPLLLLLLAPIYSLMIWLHVRLSPALPLIVLRRSFAIGEAWTATKGEFWRLFAGYLVIVLILLAAYLATLAIVAGPYWAAMIRGASPAMAAEAVAGIGPLTITGWFINGAMSVFAYALWAGSVGTATQQLIGAEGGIDYAETFG